MIHFCSACASPVDLRIPEGDNRLRPICSRCGHIHYENPRLVVGCVVEHERRILLCRRAIEPRHGFWTLPAGFMENGETTADAALRETLEEACANALLDAPFAMVSIPHISQVHLFYRGTLPTQVFSPGTESLEVALFDEADIPWQELAFRSVSLCLKHYFADRRAGRFGFHTADLAPL